MSLTLPACPNCNETAEFLHAKFCENCGTSFASPNSLPAEETASAPKQQGCPCCGSFPFFIDQDGFCSDCGKRAPSVPSSDPLGGEFIEADEKFASYSHVGRRHHVNQDAACLLRTDQSCYLAAADGVSSSQNSETASDLSTKTWLESARNAFENNGATPEAAMEIGFRAAHQKTIQLDYNPASGLDEPETTLVAAIVIGRKATVGWVGDSRAYAIDAKTQSGRLLTRDDSWMATAIDAGMSEAEANLDPRAHAITQCLGTRDEEPTAHVVTFELSQTEELLLCTDGLWNYFPEPSQIASSCKAHSTHALRACQDLCARSNAAGGRDNITVAILRF